ncbi:MAG TPA: GH25 family lysozyme [Ktedonobacteraceae bacterium]
MSKAQKFLKRKYLPVLLALVCLLTVVLLLSTGIIWPNFLFVPHDSVRGLDVSSYQKRIDWKSVAQTGQYAFIFIKATEGESYQDASFQMNWRGTKEQGLLRGAYHFYTASLTGAEQANHYISVVPKEAGMLPPVLDLEVSGKSRTALLREIKVFLDRLEHHYAMKPIIYTDFDRYAEYIKGHFEDYAIWIRDVLTPPQWSHVHHWTFWQYCDRGQVSGIAGWVDFNVFSGGRDKLKELATSSLSQTSFMG